MKRIISMLLLLLLIMKVMGANDRPELSVSNLPEILKKNAYGVVVNHTHSFEYKTPTSATEKISVVTTILKKEGDDLADFRCSIDKFRDLRNFSGLLFDSQGKLLRKFKMSDIVSTEYSAEMASDAKHFFLDIDLPVYPLTIVYEYEISWKNGILTFPTFCPQTDFNLAVVNSTFRLMLPAGTNFQYKAINMTDEPKQTTSKDFTSYEWAVSNIPAIEEEILSPSLSKKVPIVYSNPKNFIYDGVPGQITDWESMGAWQFNLNNGRDIIGPEMKIKILEMTKDAKSDKEKVKILYDFLGKTTRYVSIQLGIGGLQPMTATEVNRTGFGDCKGLSNYLKAMLNVVGIASNYTVIRMDKEDKPLFHDYANFFQTNHVILQVPLPGDTLWLECTNPRIPFGFVHNGISGHDALINMEKESKICKLPDYPDSLNIDKHQLKVTLNADGSAKVDMEKRLYLKIYDDYDWFTIAKGNEQADELREMINLPDVAMGNLKVCENKSERPNLQLSYSWTTPLYGNQTGSRLFIPVNPCRSAFKSLKKSKRQNDIYIGSGFKNIDSIYVAIPEGFEIESIPAIHGQNTSFGNFKSEIRRMEKGVLIRQTTYIPSGEYKASEYANFVDFIERINSAYRSVIILRKKS